MSYNIYNDNNFFKFLFLFKIILFIYFLVFVAVHGLSLVVENQGPLSLSVSLSLSLQCEGFSMWCLLLLKCTGFMCTGFMSCSTWTQQLWPVGSKALAQQLWCTGLVALWHVGYSLTRSQTIVLCFARQILNHWTTREGPPPFFFNQ